MNANMKENPRLKGFGYKVKWKRTGQKVSCKLELETFKLSNFVVFGEAFCMEDDKFDMIHGMFLSLKKALTDAKTLNEINCRVIGIRNTEVIKLDFLRTYGRGKCEQKDFSGTGKKAINVKLSAHDFPSKAEERRYLKAMATSPFTNKVYVEDYKEYDDLMIMEELLGDYFEQNVRYKYTEKKQKNSKESPRSTILEFTGKMNGKYYFKNIVPEKCKDKIPVMILKYTAKQLYNNIKKFEKI